MKRIRRLLRQPEMPGFALLPLVSAGLLIALAAVVLSARPTPPAPIPAVAAVAPQIPQLPAPVRQAPPSPVPAGPASQAFANWLAEDAAYIITDEERAAFQNLRDDQERQQFIAQFWQRRDPTPGTIENEYRDEHYNRIAYANERFTTTSGIPGWKTDRGRILIMRGKPDEIESHPSGAYTRPGGGALTTFPFEMWLYKFIEGVGNNVLIQFVDSTGTGEFRQTVDPSPPVRQDAGYPVSVIGAVRMPGIYQVKGEKHLVDFLAMAQGVIEGAQTVEIVHKTNGGARSTTIALDALFREGRTDLNVLILPGDVINIR